MGAARLPRLWTVPPAALAAYTAGEWSQPRQSRAPYSTSRTGYNKDSEPSKSNVGSDAHGEEGKDDGSIWNNIGHKLDGVKQTVGSGEWADVSSIKDYIIPDWTRFIPATAQKLQRELSLSPGSLADDIWKEARDPNINPEILRDAEVRVSGELCDEEQEFRQQRQRRVVKALSSYLNIPEEDIHPDDVPVIAMCGSGGGLRALVAGTGSYLAAQEAGLWDCITYTAGVSGSCWLQTLYHSSIAQRDFDKLVDHLKNRLGVHIAFPPGLWDVTSTQAAPRFPRRTSPSRS